VFICKAEYTGAGQYLCKKCKALFDSEKDAEEGCLGKNMTKEEFIDALKDYNNKLEKEPTKPKNYLPRTFKPRLVNSIKGVI